MQRELSYGTICLRVFLKLKIYLGSNANKIMPIKITEDKSIKIHGNCVHMIFSNSSKMYFKNNFNITSVAGQWKELHEAKSL